MDDIQVKSYLINNLKFTFDDVEKLEVFKNILIEANKVHNFIGESTVKSIWSRHILDSAQLVKYIDFSKNNSLSDFGTGGGFPGIVLAIFNKNIKFHVKLYEKSPVKAEFLRKIVKILKIDCEIYNIDITTQEIRDYYVVCRAFKKLGEIIKISREKIPVNHKIIILKGKNAQDEAEKTLNIKNYKYKLTNSITDKESKILIVDVIKK